MLGTVLVAAACSDATGPQLSRVRIELTDAPADMFGKGVLPQTVPEMQALTGVFNSDRMQTRTRAQAGLDGVSLKSTSDSKEDVPF